MAITAQIMLRQMLKGGFKLIVKYKLSKSLGQTVLDNLNLDIQKERFIVLDWFRGLRNQLFFVA